MTNGLDEKKKRNFISNMIEDYLKHIIIDKYLENRGKQERDVNLDKFVQIGIRPLLNKEIFDSSTHYLPIVFGLAKSIAIKEKDYFIESILKDDDIEGRDIKKDDFSFPKLNGFIGDWRANLFLSIDLEREWLTSKDWIKYMKFEETLLLEILSLDRYKKSKRCKVFSVPNESIENKIIILDTIFNVWFYIEFHNEITDRDERLDIRILGEKDGKIEFILRTLNLFYYDSKYIKIIDLID